MTIDENNHQEIVDLSKKFLAHSKQIYPENASTEAPVYLLLNLTKKALINENILQSFEPLIHDRFIQGFVIWIDDFQEHKSSPAAISAMIELVKKLNKRNKEIHILHGGYFSLLLKHFGVCSVSHGIGYGEAKSGAIARSRGGAPLVRYYIKELRRFYTLDTAEDILTRFPELICDCVACRKSYWQQAKSSRKLQR